MNRHLTARCRLVQNGSQKQYQFFCDLSGALVCSVKAADSPEDAWESAGRERFNRCCRCGRWVCDTMYNPDTLQCVDCSPWEEQPSFCPQCGAKVPTQTLFWLYQRMHRLCPVCDTVLSPRMRFCPHCGAEQYNNESVLKGRNDL